MKRTSKTILCIALLVAMAGLLLQADAHAGRLVDIQSAMKGRVSGWKFEHGAGTRSVQAIEVKFKINKAGSIELPIFAVYLYDRNKNLVTKITSFLVHRGTSYQEGHSKVFKGKTTHVIAFPYTNDTRFKYFLVVAGRQGELTTKLSPANARLQDFTYDEKGQS